MRLVARQLCGEHTRQGAPQTRTIGHYSAGALTLFAPGLTPVEIERLIAEQWRRYRAIRLWALADTPDAFARTHAEEAALAPEDWRARLSNGSATFVAVIDGADVGLVTGAEWRGRNGVAGLFGMWVAPHTRNNGVGTTLVRAAIDWARFTGFERLALEVADQNKPAIELYRRMGIEPSGPTSNLPPPREHITEHERSLALWQSKQ